MTLANPPELAPASSVRGFRRPLPEAQSPLPETDAPRSVVFDHVGKVYRSSSGPVHALDDIDLSIPRGSIFGIIGRSGAGKSSLLRTINGLEAPSAGRVVVDGQDVAALDKAGLIALRRRVGMIFQHFNLLSAKTVWQQHCASARRGGRPEGRDRPTRRRSRRPDRSRGQRARLPFSPFRRTKAARRNRPGACPSARYSALRRGDFGARPGNDAVDFAAAQGHQPTVQNHDRPDHARDERHP